MALPFLDLKTPSSFAHRPFPLQILFCLVTCLWMNAASPVIAQDPPEPEAGTFDSSFGENGLLVARQQGVSSSSFSTFTQTADGKMLVGGFRRVVPGDPYEWVVQRFLSDGSLDTAFGNNGTAALSMPGWSAAWGSTTTQMYALQDGRILVAGYSGNDVILARFLESGLLDTSFNQTGTSRYAFGYNYPVVTHLHQTPDGRVYVLCKVSVGGVTINLALLSVSQGGTISSIFQDLPTHVKTPGHPESRGSALTSSPSGDLYIGGATMSNSSISSPETPIILRLPVGSSASGIQRLSATSGAGYVAGLMIDSNDMILVGEVKKDGRALPGVISRYYRDGTPDPLFMAGGSQSFPAYTGNDAFFGLALQTDGKILVAPIGGNALVRRLMPSGVLDTSFGNQGELPPTYDAQRNLQLQPDGKILIGRSRYDTASLTIARIHPGPRPPLDAPAITTQSEPVVRVPLGQPLTLSVTLAGDQPVIYEWRKNGKIVQKSNLTTEPTSTLSIAAPTLPATSSIPDDDYTVVIRNEQGWTFSAPMKVHAIAPPVIHFQSGPEAVVQGRGSFIKASIEGRAPIRYRLLRDGEVISNGVASHNSARRTAEFVVYDPGNYEVILTNDDGEAQTEIFSVLLQNDPYIWIGHDHLYEVGEAGATLISKWATASSGEVDWRKDGRVVQSYFWKDYFSMPDQMTLANAGTYTATIRTPKKRFTSAPIEIGVVDTSPQTAYMAAGRKVTLAAAVAGNRLTYTWKKDGEPLTASRPLPKVTDKTLVIAKPELADAGIYVCTATHPNGQTLDAGAITLISDATAPVPLASVIALSDGRLGETYQFDLHTENRTVSYAITGLPKGLILDKATGIITGQPMVAGDFKVKITATNLAGSTKFELSLKILPLAYPIAGVYEGLEHNSNTSLSVKITVTATATFSAKIRVQNDEGKSSSRSLTGHLTRDGDGLYRFDPEYPRHDGDKAYTLLFFTLDPEASGPVSYALQGDVESHIGGGSFKGIRKGSWKTGSALSKAFSGYYTVALDHYSSGTASFTVSSTGNFTFSGKLWNGTALTCASWLDENGRFPVSIWRRGMLKRYKGWGIITPDAASQYRHSGVRSQDVARNYNNTSGFIGTKYLPPNIPDVSTALMLNVPLEVPNNVTIELYGYALDSLPFNATLTAKHRLSIPPLGKPSLRDSVQVTSLVFNPTKGTFTAGVQMHYFDPITDKHAGTRHFSFKGLTTRDPDTLKASAAGCATWTARSWDEWEERYYNEKITEMILITPKP